MSWKKDHPFAEKSASPDLAGCFADAPLTDPKTFCHFRRRRVVKVNGGAVHFALYATPSRRTRVRAAPDNAASIAAPIGLLVLAIVVTALATASQ